MALTTNQIIIIIGCAVFVVVGGIIAAIVLSRPKDQTDPDYITKAITEPISKSTKPEIKISTIKREITIPVQGCWSSAITGEYCTKIILPSNIKATPFRSPKSRNLKDLLKEMIDASKINMLVKCNLNNNVLEQIVNLDFENKDFENQEFTNQFFTTPSGILDIEEIPAGKTKTFSIQEKVIGFKFIQV